MYTRYFGLQDNPFALPPDPRYLYMSTRYQEALAHLTYGITQGGGFVQLTGEVGTGKTMMIRALLDRLPAEVDIALVLYPLLSVEEFVAVIFDDLAIPRPESGGSLKNAIDHLNKYLLDSHAKGRRTVLVIDEAHKLSHEVLEQVRLLTNLETTKEKLLQILLVGQPELTSLLAQADLRQLAQRITARYNLTPLTRRETAEYVITRLRVAGAQHPIFTRGALDTVHRLSRGTPRLINTLCDRSLLGAYAHGKNRVTGAIVRRASAEIGYVPPRRTPRYSQRAALAAGIVALAVAGIWQFVSYRGAPSPVSSDVAVASQIPPAMMTQTTVAGAPGTEATSSLGALLDDTSILADSDAALAALFARWHKDYNELAGATGCERAEKAGLRCIYASGNWNNLRELNRPTIIELLGQSGRRHQVLVTSFKEDNVALELGGQKREFPRAEVERYWYGKYLTLWRPPVTGDTPLRMGVQGPAIVWLRAALARANGKPALAEDRAIFDAHLAEQVKAFQRRHRLEPDGVAGRNTLVYLDGYEPEPSPPSPLAETSVSVKTR